MSANATVSAVQENRSVLSRSAGPPDETVSYGPHVDHVADVRHGTGGRRLPLVLFVHGGFWRPEYDRTHTAPLAEAVAGAGWTIATIEYRRTPGRPDDTVDDVALAVRTLRSVVQGHSGEFIVAGHSAGGHLAVWHAHTHPALGLAGVVALAPVVDLRLADERNLGDGAVQAFLGGSAAERPDLDPVRLAPSSSPVTIVHGNHDSIVPVEIGRSYATAHPATRVVAIDDAAHFEVIDPLSSAWPVVLSELTRLSGRD